MIVSCMHGAHVLHKSCLYSRYVSREAQGCVAPEGERFSTVFRHDLCNLCHALLLLTCVVWLKFLL